MNILQYCIIHETSRFVFICLVLQATFIQSTNICWVSVHEPWWQGRSCIMHFWTNVFFFRNFLGKWFVVIACRYLDEYRQANSPGPCSKFTENPIYQGHQQSFVLFSYLMGDLTLRSPLKCSLDAFSGRVYCLLRPPSFSYGGAIVTEFFLILSWRFSLWLPSRVSGSHFGSPGCLLLFPCGSSSFLRNNPMYFSPLKLFSRLSRLY